MTETNDAIYVTATIARLSELEAERDTLLETLRKAKKEMSEVLSCYETPEPAAKKPAAKKPTAKKERKARAANVTDEQIANAVEMVREGNAKDVAHNVLACAKRRGLVVCSGRGRAATYTVA